MKVCPSCGSHDKQFVGAFCIDCVSKQPLAELRPAGLELHLCPKCGRVKDGSEWVDFTPSVVGKLVERKSKSKYPFTWKILTLSLGKKFVTTRVLFVFTVEGVAVRQEENIEIPLEKKQCLACSRQSGGYREAIVQIRGDARKSERLLRNLESILEGKTFWKVEEKKTGGFDVTAGSKQAVFAALSQLRVPFKLSHKLIGVREGKRIFLVTILVSFGS